MRETIEKAGLKVDEFGSLCGVTRVAVYRWFDGHKPDKLRERRVSMVLSALTKAVEVGDLPIERPSSRKVDKIVVLQRIKEIVIKHLKDLSEAD